jgi:hypothetical protein
MARSDVSVMNALRAAVFALLVSGAVHAEDNAKSDAPPLSTVDVVGKRDALRQQVVEFVGSLTQLEGELIMRWRSPRICLLVAADDPALEGFVRQRLVEIATDVPVPIDRHENCKPNLFVLITARAQQFVASWKQRDPGMFRWKPRKGMARSSEELPVRTWHNARVEQSNGVPMLVSNLEGWTGSNAPRAKSLGSRIASNVAESLSAVVVLVDTKSLKNVTAGQLADYVAMVGFANPDVEADLGAIETVLKVFDEGPPEAHSAGLTAWDRAFLRGLYRSSYTPVQHRSAIAVRMVSELASK